MALIPTVAGATVTQRFGPSGLAVEPGMWADGDRAWWSFFAGARFFNDFHPGIDRAAPQGTPVRAMEAGTVSFAGWRDNISGFQVGVEIQDGTSFSVNHLSRVLVRLGQRVGQGDTIGLVGATGATTGPHTHEGLELDGALWNVELFMAGGARARDPRIAPAQRTVQLNGAGINIRKADEFLFDRESVYAVSKSDGIYRLGTGKRIGPLSKEFPFLRIRETTEGDFAVVAGFGRRLAIRRTLVHFT